MLEKNELEAFDSRTNLGLFSTKYDDFYTDKDYAKEVIQRKTDPKAHENDEILALSIYFELSDSKILNHNKNLNSK